MVCLAGLGVFPRYDYWTASLVALSLCASLSVALLLASAAANFNSPFQTSSGIQPLYMRVVFQGRESGIDELKIVAAERS